MKTLMTFVAQCAISDALSTRNSPNGRLRLPAWAGQATLPVGSSKSVTVKTTLLILVIIVLGATRAAFAGGRSSANAADPGVMPADGRFHGLTYDEWAVRWWQWLAKTDTPSSPFLDPTANFAVGQSGPVWNLVAWGANPVVAEGTVPEGTALFFPCSTFNDFGPFGVSPDETFKIIENSGGEIDGVSIDHPDALVTNPFLLTFTADNIFGLAPGDYGPVVAAGFFVLVRPLPVGNHTIHFYYDLVNVPYAGHYEVNYHVTVVPSAMQ
jgi:hypothetical protein